MNRRRKKDKIQSREVENKCQKKEWGEYVTYPSVQAENV